MENIYGHPEFRGPQAIATMSGHYVDGVKQGGWVEQYYPGSFGEYTFEGPYVDGQPHGRWITHRGVHPDSYAHNQCTDEGLMVQGKRDGEWIDRCNNGYCHVREHANGKKINDWSC